MHKLSEFNDGKATPGLYQWEFQNKTIKNCRELIYWFHWGDYLFDIREVRRHYKRKPAKVVDTKEMYPFAKFKQQVEEIIKLVGDEDFEQVLLKCAREAKKI